MTWCFTKLVRMFSTQDYKFFRGLYKMAYKVGGPEIPRIFRERALREENRKLLAELREDDLWGQELGTKEDVHGIGRANTLEESAVARNLTVMSEINRVVLADEKLWRWIEAVFEQEGPG